MLRVIGPSGGPGSRGTGRRRRALTLAVLACLVAAGPESGWAQSTSGRRSILQLVSWGDPDSPGWRLLGDAFRRQVADSFQGPVEYSVEFLELSRDRPPEYQRQLRSLLRAKHGGRIDVVVAIGAPALELAMGDGEALLPGVPIVFGLVEPQDLARLRPGPAATGVTLEVDPSGSLEAALAIQPEIRRVVVVGGTTPLDQRRLAEARRAFEGFEDRLEFSYLSDLPISETLARVRSLPRGTIVLVLHVFRDGAGEEFLPYDAFAMIARASSVPVYGVLDSYLGGGMVGGRTGSFRAQGASMGMQAARVLGGTPPDRLPVRALDARVVYDWPQLERWGLGDRQPPTGAVVRNRPPDAWEEYRQYIAGALLVGLLEAVLIGMLLVQRAARRKVERSLRRQVRFLSLVIELSSSSHRQFPEAVESWLDGWVRRLGEFLGLDRVALVEERHGTLQVTHAWSADPTTFPQPPRAELYPWTSERLRRGETVRVTRLDDLPPEAAADRAAWRQEGVKSLLAIPLTERDRTTGALALVTRRSERAWDEELTKHLGLVADIFAHALITRRTESARAASERLSETLLGVLPGATAVLDADGRVAHANEAWLALGRDPGRNGLPWAPVGGNYLEACRRSVAAPTGFLDADALSGIRSALEGTRREFRIKYHLPPGHPRELIVVPLSPPEGGSVVSSIDSTDVERAEREAQELRQTIAHFDRVVALGDLSSSLAHELNQPLTAILTNVQAARRFLAAGPEGLEEVREILTDIEDDDRRAGEVIRRLRALLRKDTAAWEPLRLDQLALEVADLVASDARARQVRIRLQLDDSLAPVRGDRVQLFQVLLNLVTNGADAMQSTAAEGRELTIRTWRHDDRTVGLSVRDRGTGIHASPMERIFEPFYTSKPEGLGMGLSICQSILQAHGGRIWATNNPDRGATFHVVLPVVREEAR